MMDLIAVQLYLTGWVCLTVILFLVAPKIPAFYKRREQEAMKKAFDSESSRSEARTAGKKAERARNNWYEFSRFLEAAEAGDRLGYACALVAFFWGAFLALGVVAFVLWAIARVVDIFHMTRIWCDECDTPAPWGVTTSVSRKKAAALGWAVDDPKDEDYCPPCVAARRAAAPQ